MLRFAFGALVFCGFFKPSLPLSFRVLGEGGSFSAGSLQGGPFDSAFSAVRGAEEEDDGLGAVSSPHSRLPSADGVGELLESPWSSPSSFSAEGEGEAAEDSASEEKGIALLAVLADWDAAQAQAEASEDSSAASSSRSPISSSQQPKAFAHPPHAADLEEALRAFAIPSLQVQLAEKPGDALGGAPLVEPRSSSSSASSPSRSLVLKKEKTAEASSAEEAVSAARRSGLSSLATLVKTGIPKLANAAETARAKSETESARRDLTAALKSAFAPPASLDVEAGDGVSAPTRFELLGVCVVEEDGLFAEVQSAPRGSLKTVRLHRLACEAGCSERPSLAPADARRKRLHEAENLLDASEAPARQAVEGNEAESEEASDLALLREQQAKQRRAVETGSVLVKKALLTRLRSRLLLPERVGHLAVARPVVAVAAKELLVNSVEVYGARLVKLHRVSLRSLDEKWGAALQILETAALLEAAALHLVEATPTSTWVDASSGRLFVGDVQTLQPLRQRRPSCDELLKRTWPQYLPPEEAAACRASQKKSAADERLVNKQRKDKTQQNQQKEEPAIANAAAAAWSCGLFLFHLFCQARLPFGLSAVAAQEDSLSNLQQLFTSESADKRLSLDSCDQDPRAKWLLRSLLHVRPERRALPLALLKNLLNAEALADAAAQEAEL